MRFGPICGNFGAAKQQRDASQWPRGLRRGSAAARLLRLWVRVPTGDMDCLLWVLCVSATGWSLVQRSPSVVWVWSRNLVNEEALTHWGGAVAPSKIKMASSVYYLRTRHQSVESKCAVNMYNKFRRPFLPIFLPIRWPCCLSSAPHNLLNRLADFHKTWFKRTVTENGYKTRMAATLSQRYCHLIHV